MKKGKSQLSPEQQEDLLEILKTRFEKNMNRHNGLEWAKVQAKLETNTEKLWSLYEVERTGGEPDVIVFDKETGEFMIVHQKVLKVAEVFAMTVKRWSRGKTINHKTMRLIWLVIWGLKFYRKNNTGNCRNLAILIRKHPVG